MPIRNCPLPTELRLSLRTAAGGWLDAIVVPGQGVRRGEHLAEAASGGAGLPAPVSGEVSAVEGDCVCLRPDASQVPATALPPLDPASELPARLRERLLDAGIGAIGAVGGSMAAAPAADVALLIINGAMHEPEVDSDGALMGAQADAVLGGAALLARLLQAQRTVLAVPQWQAGARTALRLAAAMRPEPVRRLATPGIYPAGGERRLVEVLLARPWPYGARLADIGVVVLPVATAVAAWRAVVAGEAWTHRIVTVAGAGVSRPGNYRVAFGTPVAHLLTVAGAGQPPASRLRIGGPRLGQMPGHGQPSIGRDTAALLVLPPEAPPKPAPEPCCDCGDCVRACPAALQPQRLLAHLDALRPDHADRDGLLDCIGCGNCDLVCPSHIALAPRLRTGRDALRDHARRRQMADAARTRFEARNARLQSEGEVRAAQAAERQRTTSADAVAAAIARAKARRQAARGDGS